jgi:hypothetical protein
MTSPRLAAPLGGLIAMIGLTGCALFATRVPSEGQPYTSGSAEVRVVSGAIDPIGRIPFFFGSFIDDAVPGSGAAGANASFKSGEGWELYLDDFRPGSDIDRGVVTLVDGRDPDGERVFLLGPDVSDCTSSALTVTPAVFSGTLLCRPPAGGEDVEFEISFEAMP